MSNRANRNAASRQIRGPQSALTDFLASQNISARQIRADADARRSAALATSNQDNTGATAASSSGPVVPATSAADEGEAGPATSSARAAAVQKRKKQDEAIAKIKKTKAFKRRKRNAEDSDSEDLARAMFQEKSAPLPGQMENCEVCKTRFTVTAYSRAGPEGGLLCAKCSKEAAQDDDEVKKAKKKGPAKVAGPARRKVQSRILDGTYSVGGKSLTTLCIAVLAKNIDLADDLGDMPPVVVDRIARKLSKHRLMTSQTLGLFLQPHVDQIKVYDGAKLSSDDYIRIFQTASKLKTLKLRNAIQFKDNVMDYLISRSIELKSFCLSGANLLSEDKWRDYLTAKGQALEALQVYYTDRHFGDDLVSSLNVLTPSLRRLKIAHNQKVTDKGVEHIAGLAGLEHVGLELIQPTTTAPYVKLINGVGKSLRTFSLKGVPDVDDRVLDALHDNCRSLTKLRITHSEVMTDSGFARLFKDWVNRPLLFVDFQKCRHVDASKPRDNAHMVGLCSDGFRALMLHSGRQIKYLNIHGCRHISKDAFEEVFSAAHEYPDLQKMEISFCEEVTDFVVGSIFRSCPNLKELNVFGCMKVKDVRVPKGVILVGVPNAIGMVIEGTD